MLVSLKPIFHCDAKLLALGTFALPNAKYTTFALPNAKNTNMLVSLALGDANISRFTRCVLPDAFYPPRFTRRQSVEYRWRWAFWRLGWRWACTFHIFCIDFICIWWSTQSQYPVEYGLNTKFWRRGHCPTPAPDARYFASQWNIGFRFHLRWVANANPVSSGISRIYFACVIPQHEPHCEPVE